MSDHLELKKKMLEAVVNNEGANIGIDDDCGFTVEEFLTGNVEEYLVLRYKKDHQLKMFSVPTSINPDKVKELYNDSVTSAQRRAQSL